MTKITMSGKVHIKKGEVTYHARVYERDSKGRFISTKVLKITSDKYAKFKYAAIKTAVDKSTSYNQALGRIKSDLERTTSFDKKMNGFFTFRDKMHDMMLGSGDVERAKMFFLMNKMGPEKFNEFYMQYQDDVKSIYENSDKNIAKSREIRDLETTNQKISKRAKEAERMVKKMQDYLGLDDEDIKNALEEIKMKDKGVEGYKKGRNPYAHYYIYHAKLGSQL